MSPSEYQELVEFLTGQFSRIDGQFSRIDSRFSRIDGQFAKIDQRFHDLTLGMDQRFTLLEGRLDAFQASVDERFREVFGHFDAIHLRLERLDQGSQVITHQLRRIEAILDRRGRPPRDLERQLNG